MSRAAFHRLARAGDSFATHCAFEASLVVAADVNGVSRAAAAGRVDPNDVRYGKGAAVQIARCQQEAVYLASVFFGRPQRSLARLLGVSQPQIHKTIVKIEDRRDDQVYDRRLDDLELELMESA